MIARLIVSAPDRLVLMLFWTCLVVAATVIPGIFQPWIVLPLLFVTLVATGRLMPDAITTTRASIYGSLSALIVALAWVVVNLPYVSRFVYVSRDPGFLTLEALWLSKHANPDIPMGTAAAVQSAAPDIFTWTNAYAPDGDMLHVQGAKLMPGILALGTWVGGERVAFAGNLAIGGLALLALYGLARRVVGPLWSLVPVIALAASVPLGAFARSAYTEPLALALVFGGLTMAWSAFHHGNWWRLGVAGAMVGASSLSRIDGGAFAIGLTAGVGLVAAAPMVPRSRWRQGTMVAAVSGPVLVMVGVGYLDLRWHSPKYLATLAGQNVLLTVALLATVAASLVLALPRFWDPIRRWVPGNSHRLSVAAMALIGVVALILISRPLWLTMNHTTGVPYTDLVKGLQLSEGLPLDGSQSYDEQSVTWLSWYYGWPMAVLAFVGLALMARRAIRHRDPRYLVLLTVVLAPSALYLWKPSVTPDQVWAMRRFLPVTIPGFLLAATIPIVRLWSIRRRWARPVAGLLAMTVAVFPAFTWGSVFTTAEQAGRWGEAKAVCSAIEGKHVLYIDPGGGPPYLGTLRIVCGVEVIEVHHSAGPSELAKIRNAWGSEDLSVVTFNPDSLTWPGGLRPPPLKTTAVTTWPTPLSHTPREPVATSSSVWVGLIHQDGNIAAVAPLAP